MHDIVKNIKGRIKLVLIADKDGKEHTILERSNVITYSGADIMARLLGGDNSYVPGYIGFVYGADATAVTLVDPDLLPDATKRVHTWDIVTQDMADATANILVSPLVLNPSYVAGSDVYSGNQITLAATTNTLQEYAFPTTGGTYAPALGDIAIPYFYQAFLLVRKVSGTNIQYTPFARVTLRNSDTGNYDAKPDGFGLGVFWTIEFN